MTSCCIASLIDEVVVSSLSPPPSENRQAVAFNFALSAAASSPLRQPVSPPAFFGENRVRPRVGPQRCAGTVMVSASPLRSCAVYFGRTRSEEHTSELQSRGHLVCRLLLEKKKVLMCTPRMTCFRDV